jgi:hypothetical protein
MALNNRNSLPPGGFPYVQKETKYRFDGMVPFEMQVGLIIDHRKANGIKPDDREAVANELDNYTCDRLGGDPEWCDGIKKNWLSVKASSLRAAAGHAVEAGEQVIHGAQILKDWLGDGGQPVSATLAQTRADTCNSIGPKGTACPKNKAAHFFSKITAEMAGVIHRQRQTKTGLGMKVHGEEKLGTCEVCGCHLPLAVHVPIDVIAGRMPEGELDKYPKKCWKRTEIEATL